MSQKMIGLAKLMGDLYVFYALHSSCTTVPPSISNKVSYLENNATLWHLWLVHVSYSVYKCMATEFPFSPLLKLAHVTFVIILNKNVCHSLLALVCLQIFLILSMLTLRGPIIAPPLMVIATFWISLMILAALLWLF